MNFYLNEVTRIKKIHYANQSQLNAVIRAKHFIDSYFNQGLDLAQLADASFTSKFHLLRLFKRYYGQTPLQYITTKRLEQSKEFLKKGMMISEACFSVGFECPSSFSTLFKRKNGLTPNQYQKSNFNKVG